MGGGSSNTVKDEWEFWEGVTDKGELQSRINNLASRSDNSFNGDPAVKEITSTNIDIMKKTVTNALNDTVLTENPTGKCPIGDYAKEPFTAATCSWQTVIKTLVVMVIVLFGIVAFTRFIIIRNSIQHDVPRGKNNIII